MTRILFAALAATFLATAAGAADVKSGPQPGDRLPGPFAPLNVNGESAGEKQCLVCKNGKNPVVAIFARNADDPAVVKLIKEVDAATAKNSGCDMGSFVVFCSDEDKLEAKLKDMVSKEKVSKTVLSIDTPAGPSKYKIAQDADVTVILYTKHEIKANHTFKKGELNDAGITAVVADVSKIVPAK